MNPDRRTALAAGAFYLLSFVSIPTLALYAGVKGEGYLLGSASDGPALWGAFLEVVVGLACIGTAVTLYPVLRRQDSAMALGFVGARTLEAAMIFVGVASILTLVSLHGSTSAAVASADPGTLGVLGEALATFHSRAFLLGQSLMPGINALLLGTLLLRSRLVPRAIPLIGLIGAPVHLTAVVLTLFGVLAPLATVTGLAAVPIALWEFSLGVYLVVKGFRPDARILARP